MTLNVFRFWRTICHDPLRAIRAQWAGRQLQLRQHLERHVRHRTFRFLERHPVLHSLRQPCQIARPPDDPGKQRPRSAEAGFGCTILITSANDGSLPILAFGSAQSDAVFSQFCTIAFGAEPN